MEKANEGNDKTTFSGEATAEELVTSRLETGFRPQDTVASFETAQGSVYTYDAEGRTTRFKTASGEQNDTQDITVFVDLTLEQEQDVLESYRAKNLTQKTKVYVVERQEDGQPKIIRTIGDVQRPDELFLAIYRDSKMTQSKQASLFPEVGCNVFDTRRYVEDGVTMSERHLGNKVTKINYKPPT